MTGSLGSRAAGAVVTTVAVAVTVLVPAPAAHAAFDVVPFGCAVTPDPRAAYAVFGYENPDPQPVEIDLGSSNLVLQPPNIRAGQPYVFAPGRHETAWVAAFDRGDTRRNEVTWYLQGALAPAAARWCTGLPPTAPDPVRLTSDRPDGAPLQVGDALHTSLPVPGGGTRAQVVMERCAADTCVPIPWSGPEQPAGGGFWVDAASVTDYTVRVADAGHRLQLRLMFFSSAGWATVVSRPTPIVAGDPGALPAVGTVDTGPPVAVGQPTVPVAPTVGEDLTADPGRWSGAAPLTVGGRWQRCTDATSATCVDIADATRPTYRPTAADLGSALRWVTTASTTGVAGSASSLPVVTTAASAPTEAVAPAPIAPPSTPSTPSTPAPPAPQPPPSPPSLPPTVTLDLSPRVFEVGGRATPLTMRTALRPRPPRGTTMVVGLSERAFVRIDVVGRDRTVTLTRWLSAGTSRLAMSGRFARSAGGALAPGRYRVVVQARDQDGRLSPAVRQSFRVVR